MPMSNDKATISEIGKEEKNNIKQEVRSSLGNSIHRNRNTVKLSSVIWKSFILLSEVRSR